MLQWTPDQLFIVTYIAAALSGVAVLLNSEKHITFRRLVGAMLLYGAAGCALSMVGYEYLGGNKYPWRVVGCGMLVGIRAIKWADIREIAMRLFSIPPPKNE